MSVFSPKSSLTPSPLTNVNTSIYPSSLRCEITWPSLVGKYSTRGERLCKYCFQDDKTKITESILSTEVPVLSSTGTKSENFLILYLFPPR